MSLLTTQSIANMLRPGLKAVFSDTTMYQPEYKQYFTTHSSDKSYEQEVEVRLLGTANNKPEGMPIQLGDMGQQTVTTYVNKAYGNGYNITQEAIDDNLYKSQWPQSTVALRASMRQYDEIAAAFVFNNGWNTNVPGGDGKPLFSLLHPTATATVANTFAVPAQLNETSMQDALIGIQKFLSASGIRNNYIGTKLILPAELQFTGNMLLDSKFRTGTANNDISASYNMSMLKEGQCINHYFNSTTAWGILTNCENGFKEYVRKEMSIDALPDPNTRTITVTAYGRKSFGFSNFRCAFGSQGA